MIQVIDPEDWGRGTLGQSFDVLMYEDPIIVTKLRASVGLMLTTGNVTAAVRAATVALAHSGEARRELALLVQKYPALVADEWFQEVASVVTDFNDFSLY